MARIRLFGTIYNAKPIEERPDGSWIMAALEHGPRFTIDTPLHVLKGEIVEMAAAEIPLSPEASFAAVEAAMAEERKALPKPAELIARHGAKLKEGTDGQKV